MSFSLNDLMGLSQALHGVIGPQQANKDPGFLRRYTQATQDPLTSPTPVAQQNRPAPQGQPQQTAQGPGLVSVLGDAAKGKFQPGSLAGGVASLFNGSPMGPSQGFSGSATAPVPDTSRFQGGTPQEPPSEPLMVRGIKPQAYASLPPQTVTAPPQDTQASQSQMVPLPPPRPSDANLFIQQPRTDAPDPHGPIGSQASIWGAGYHGPEASLFNRMGGSQPNYDQKYYWNEDGSGPTPGGPGSGLQAFTDSGAAQGFSGSAGPNLLSFLGL